jgi:hypothetical protein
MPSSGMPCRVGFVTIDDSEKRIAYNVKVERITELGTLAITSNWSTVCALGPAYC